MMKRMLVPLDGSPLAEMALDAAALLARRFAAEIVLVRVIPAEVSGAFSKTIHSRPTTEAQAYLDRVAHWLREEEVAVSTAVLSGAPAAGITQEAVLGHVDLMVMTTHGRKGLEALLHPSITWQVLTQTEAPLLVCQCGEGEEPGLMHLPRFMTDPLAPIVIPLDGSLQAESALPLAEVLARTFGNPLVLVRAVEPVYFFGMEANPQTVDEVMQTALAEAQRYLLCQQDALSRAGFLVLLALGEGRSRPLDRNLCPRVAGWSGRDGLAWPEWHGPTRPGQCRQKGSEPRTGTTLAGTLFCSGGERHRSMKSQPMRKQIPR